MSLWKHCWDASAWLLRSMDQFLSYDTECGSLCPCDNASAKKRSWNLLLYWQGHGSHLHDCAAQLYWATSHVSICLQTVEGVPQIKGKFMSIPNLCYSVSMKLHLSSLLSIWIISLLIDNHLTMRPNHSSRKFPGLNS